MKLLLAARLSRVGKRQTGIDTQDEDARAWAEAHGHQVVAVAVDRITGRVSPFDRRNLGPWLRPDRMGAYDGILVSKIDRLTRRRDWDLRQWAEENDKKIIVVSPELMWPPKPRDTATPIIWDDQVNLAAGEWENTSQRYKRMQKALRDQKLFVGKRTFGYRIVDVPGTEHKTLEPDPVQGPIVRGMANRYLEGQSFRQIRDWLIDEAIPQPQPPKERDGQGWTSQAVRGILSNPVITGRVMVNGRTYLRVESLVEWDDFQRIQEMMASRATRGAQKNVAMLTSLIACEHGHPMYRLQGRKIPTVPDGLYYYCSPERAPKGQRYLVPMAFADGQVNEAVMARGWAPHYRIEVTPGEEYANEVAHVKQDIAELDPEADNYDAELSMLRAELKRLRSLPSRPAERKAIADGRMVEEVWKSLDTVGRRQWLMDRGWRVIVTKRDEGYWIIVEPGKFLADIESLQRLGV